MITKHILAKEFMQKIRDVIEQKCGGNTKQGVICVLKRNRKEHYANYLIIPTVLDR